METTDFWRELLRGIYGPRQGGARIIVDSRDAATGSGKTSLAVGLARLLSQKFGYDLETEDFVLSPSRYTERWQAHPGEGQPSVLVLDELSGGGAADARRAMSSSNVQLSRAWEMMRAKRVVTIVTLPHWGYADSKLQQLADYRLVCNRRPIGQFAAYEVGASFDSGDVRTRKLDSGVSFPDLASAGCPYYEALDEKKREVLEAAQMDADAALVDEATDDTPDPDEVDRETRKEIAQKLRANGATCDEAGEAVGRSKSWVSRHTDAETAE